MTRRRQLLTGAVAGAATLAGGGLAWWHREADAGDPLAAMWAMRFERPEGGELAMASLRGKPLLINFWATWCAPCLREMPEINRFHQDFVKRQGQVLGLAIDSAGPVREFLKRVKIGFTIGLAGLDGTDLVHQLGNMAGALPFSVLIGQKGTVLQRKMGETSYDELRRWTKDL